MHYRPAVQGKSFDIRELFMQCNRGSCFENITESISLYFYMCVSLLVCKLCVWCVFDFVSERVWLRETSNQES